eukprot:342506-Hanusia_phi.AAC.4
MTNRAEAIKLGREQASGRKGQLCDKHLTKQTIGRQHLLPRGTHRLQILLQILLRFRLTHGDTAGEGGVHLNLLHFLIVQLSFRLASPSNPVPPLPAHADFAFLQLPLLYARVKASGLVLEDESQLVRLRRHGETLFLVRTAFPISFLTSSSTTCRQLRKERRRSARLLE